MRSRRKRRDPKAFGFDGAGLPLTGPAPIAPGHRKVPYEVATSTEPKRLLSNGSPPSRGSFRGGTQPSRSRQPPEPSRPRADVAARVNFETNDVAAARRLSMVNPRPRIGAARTLRGPNLAFASWPAAGRPITASLTRLRSAIASGLAARARGAEGITMAARVGLIAVRDLELEQF